MSSDKNSSSNISIPQKYLEKILKLQQDQDKTRQEETSILKSNLEQMNILLAKLITSTNTNINIAEGQKSIPYSRSNTVNVVQLTQPANPEDYAEITNIYTQNDNRPIQYMTIVNDGPGLVYFIVAHSKMDVSTQEILLNVNDQRELFNVYEIRLRVTMPTTSYRLVEGVFRTGSFAPATKANVEIRPTLQTNEILKTFDCLFENATPTITITSPTTQTFLANYGISSFQPPLPPGRTATFVDTSTTLAMPYLVPSGNIIEAFAYFGNTTTDASIRIWLEPLVNSQIIFGTKLFSLRSIIPFSNRGTPFNFVPNINIYNTQGFDPKGAPYFDIFGNPAPGRYVLFTITNDDPFNNLIGNPFFIAIIRQLSTTP